MFIRETSYLKLLEFSTPSRKNKLIIGKHRELHAFSPSMWHIPKYDCTEIAQWTSEKFYKSGLELIEAVLEILLYLKSENDSAVQGAERGKLFYLRYTSNPIMKPDVKEEVLFLLLQKIAVW